MVDCPRAGLSLKGTGWSYASWRKTLPVVDCQKAGCPKAFGHPLEEALGVNQLAEDPASDRNPRIIQVLCYAEGVRDLNSRHVCPSKNQSLEEKKRKKER